MFANNFVGIRAQQLLLVEVKATVLPTLPTFTLRNRLPDYLSPVSIVFPGDSVFIHSTLSHGGRLLILRHKNTKNVFVSAIGISYIQLQNTSILIDYIFTFNSDSAKRRVEGRSVKFKELLYSHS